MPPADSGDERSTGPQASRLVDAEEVPIAFNDGLRKNGGTRLSPPIMPPRPRPGGWLWPSRRATTSKKTATRLRHLRLDEGRDTWYSRDRPPAEDGVRGVLADDAWAAEDASPGARTPTTMSASQELGTFLTERPATSTSVGVPSSST